jgi:DNA-binding transcriptional LysR family regulator
MHKRKDSPGNVALDWNDLQTFLAVARKGSVLAASRWLGVNHSTVLRRLGALEAAMGQRLFDRLPSGYVPTTEGQALVAQLADLPERIETAHRRLAGGDLAIEGEIRLTTTDTLSGSLLMPCLAAFRDAHPAVRLQLVLDNGFLNLTQREADVAVRGSNRPPENLVGRPVGRIRTALYASRDYLPTLGDTPDPAQARWIGHDASLAGLDSAKWLRKHVAADRIALRVDNLVAMADAVAAGIGIGYLLCPLADERANLVRIGEPVASFDTTIWVLTHPDLRHVARIRALTDFLVERLRADPRLAHDRH